MPGPQYLLNPGINVQPVWLHNLLNRIKVAPASEPVYPTTQRVLGFSFLLGGVNEVFRPIQIDIFHVVIA
jgi:hypothetical protein